MWDYLGLSWTRVQVQAGKSKLLLFETFFFSPTGSIEELALLKRISVAPLLAVFLGLKARDRKVKPNIRGSF